MFCCYLGVAGRPVQPPTSLYLCNPYPSRIPQYSDRSRGKQRAAYNKMGNDQPDLAAGWGARAHNQGLVLFASWVKSRNDAYAEFLAVIMNTMGKILTAARDNAKLIKKQNLLAAGLALDGPKGRLRELRIVTNTLIQPHWKKGLPVRFSFPSERDT